MARGGTPFASVKNEISSDLDIAQGSLGGWPSPLPAWLVTTGDAVQGVKPGASEVGFSDVPDMEPPLGVPGVLTDEGLPGALSDELGVHGELKFPSDRDVSDALGVPEHSDSLVDGLVACAILI